MHPSRPKSEWNLRRALWWWILQTDQHYSITLNRPLAISITGNCSPPEVSCFHVSTQRLIGCYFRFNNLTREILTNTDLCKTRLDDYTHRLTSLLDSIPITIRFSTRWLEPGSTTPPWPVDAQAVSLHQQVHNYIIFLNKQRQNGPISTRQNFDIVSTGFPQPGSEPQVNKSTLRSCREILASFQYFSSRQRRGWINWSACQQAYNAAIILASSSPRACEIDDRSRLMETYHNLSQIHQLGIHDLAKTAAENLRARLCGNQVEPKSMDTQGPNGDSVSSYRTAGLRSSTTYSDLESKGIANNVKSNRTASRKGHAKDEPTNSTPIKKARLSALSSANKGTKGSALRKCRNKQSLSPATGVPASSSSALEARNRVGPSPLYANNECKRPSTAGDDLTAQLSIKSPNTASLLSPVTTDLSYPYRPLTSASVSAADACVLDQFYLDRQISLASTSTVDMQPFNALASPTTRPCPINYPSQPPSLSSHSYPPSIYTNSIPSSLHTPSASHPVSPMLGQGTLAMVTDGQPSFCGGQPITQPQTPSWPFDADHGIENTDCLMTDLNAFGQQDDVRWVWPNAGSW